MIRTDLVIIDDLAFVKWCAVQVERGAIPADGLKYIKKEIKRAAQSPGNLQLICVRILLGNACSSGDWSHESHAVYSGLLQNLRITLGLPVDNTYGLYLAL